ncbi:hypothetical protein [Undibacterium sp. TS12]|uniref:hypothetical protein n=1 Tax=Undibacterium sp. TS12 TaxID=2908202 RepID=UPI001F4C8599|nr:hypothetical protein [Undibacterium sp. TS12]MCH8621204.1 hypothetical protein [Undibacterium sp. TS12]
MTSKTKSTSCHGAADSPGSLLAVLRAWIDRLNVYMDARPMPEHHRLGAWERILRQSVKRQ